MCECHPHCDRCPDLHFEPDEIPVIPRPNPALDAWLTRVLAENAADIAAAEDDLTGATPW